MALTKRLVLFLPIRGCEPSVKTIDSYRMWIYDSTSRRPEDEALRGCPAVPRALAPRTRNEDLDGCSTIGAHEAPSPHQGTVWPTVAFMSYDDAMSEAEAYDTMVAETSHLFDVKTASSGRFRRLLSAENKYPPRRTDIAGHPAEWGNNSESEYTKSTQFQFNVPGYHTTKEWVTQWSCPITCIDGEPESPVQAKLAAESVEQIMTSLGNLFILNNECKQVNRKAGFEELSFLLLTMSNLEAALANIGGNTKGEGRHEVRKKLQRLRPYGLTGAYSGSGALFVRFLNVQFEAFHILSGMYSQFEDDIKELAVYWDLIRNPCTHEPVPLNRSTLDKSLLPRTLGTQNVVDCVRKAFVLAREAANRSNIFPISSMT